MEWRKISLIAIFIIAALLRGGQEEEKKILTLSIGDRTLRDKTLAVFPGQVYSARLGRAIPFARMVQEMKESDFVFIGETHTSLTMHEVQQKIIQALYEQDRNLCVGLEMFPVTSEEVLTKWSMGILSEDEFIRESRWYINWNYNFGFYQRIFQFGKECRIPFYGLNAPRETITRIRMNGWEALSEEEKRIVPRPDLSHEEHRFLIRTIFESTELPHQMKGKGLETAFEGLYRAQSAWDEVMASNALKARRRENKKVVVLAGSGHLLYNLGINRRAYEKGGQPSKTVICVSVPEGEESVRVSRSLADYVWGIPAEDRPAFPHIGLRLKNFEGLENPVVESKPIDGVALNAGFEKGDVILFVDGRPFSDINELRAYLAALGWGDRVNFRILRTGAEVEIVLTLE